MFLVSWRKKRCFTTGSFDNEVEPPFSHSSVMCWGGGYLGRGARVGWVI